MGDTVQAQRVDARIEQDLPSGPGRGIARLDRIEVGNQTVEHRLNLQALPSGTANIGGPFRPAKMFLSGTS